MNKDQFFLLLILLAFFALIFCSIYLIPILFARQRSKHFGLKIKFKQARFLAKNKCLKKDFLIGAKDILTVYPVNLDELVNHYYAGGDLKNLKSGINEMLMREKEPNIKVLIALDLTNKDLKIEVEKAEKNKWIFTY